MLGGDESKKVVCAAIKGDLTGKISDYRFATEPQYFLEGFLPSAGDIAIDGGAYDGATALAFAKRGARNSRGDSRAGRRVVQIAAGVGGTFIQSKASGRACD